MASGGEKEKKGKNNEKKPSAQEPKNKGKLPRRSPAARSRDAIRMSAKDGVSYVEILKVMKAKVKPQNSGAGVLSIRRTMREEILLVLKKGGDVSAFEKELDRVVGEKVDVTSLVSRRTLEVRDLDETVTREEVVATLCIALGKPSLGDTKRLSKDKLHEHFEETRLIYELVWARSAGSLKDTVYYYHSYFLLFDA